VATEPVLPDSAEDPPINLLETRAVIEQAKGILMATYRCGPDEALDLLRRAAQADGLKVHMLAAKVVELAKRGLTITDSGRRKT
jgi:ANTAR domain-containing protein